MKKLLLLTTLLCLVSTPYGFTLNKNMYRPMMGTSSIDANQKTDAMAGLNHFSSELKTYKGEYTWGSIKGVAKYQYLDKEGGGRIFEGDFLFNSNNSFVFMGKMKNNRQFEEWKYQWLYIDDFYNESEVLTSTIYFNENGNPTGKFEVYNLGGKTLYRGTIKSGYIINDFYFKNHEIEIWGQYNSNGKPIGEWKCKTKVRGTLYSAKSNYSDDGRMLKNWYWTHYDNSTGDTTERRLYIETESYYPNGLQSSALSSIKKLMIRDSSF